MTGREESLRAIEAELGVLVRRVRRVIGERARAVHPDLQPASYLVLSHLHESGPRRAAAVAEDLGTDKAALSRQLQHLAELGLLERAPDPDDGRATLLSATEDAKERLTRVRGERSARFDERLGGWGAAELADFAGTLGRYNQALDDRQSRSQTAVSAGS